MVKHVTNVPLDLDLGVLPRLDHNLATIFSPDRLTDTLHLILSVRIVLQILQNLRLDESNVEVEFRLAQRDDPCGVQR